MKTFSVATILGLAAMTHAHMEMSDPPPFRSKFNSFSTDIDYSMTNPLSDSGSNFPCKGYHSLYDTPQGASVANWQAGQAQSLTITGSATHNGGSCQASLSFDKGNTWKVIHSYIGGCPLQSKWDFTIPTDTPSGDALFAWTWFNNVGNREMYMNCARVTISGAAQKAKRAPSDSINSRPNMFVANAGNGCTTEAGKDVLFPQPGPDISTVGQNTAAPIGTCGAGKRSARDFRV